MVKALLVLQQKVSLTLPKIKVQVSQSQTEGSKRSFSCLVLHFYSPCDAGLGNKTSEVAEKNIITYVCCQKNIVHLLYDGEPEGSMQAGVEWKPFCCACVWWELLHQVSEF
ncbi:hypothetical protein DsansV1_C13g0122201 [Dioscorea sansibarensis]